MQLISFDAETHSPVDLRKAGAYAYAANPKTDCLLFAYHAVGSPGLPSLWRQGDPVPFALIGHIQNGGSFSGWNVSFFDRLIWRDILVPRYGFPPIDDDRWIDSAQRAAAANLPRSLDGCAQAVGIDFKASLKDNNRLRRITDAKRTPVPTEDDLTWLAERCIQDVVMEEQVLLRLPVWFDMEPWLAMPAIDVRINDRGVLMDVALVRGLAQAAATETHRLDQRMAGLTHEKVPATSNVEALKHWLFREGVDLPRKETPSSEDDEPEDDDSKTETGSPWRLRKSDIADLLARDDVPEHCREALELRQGGSESLGEETAADAGVGER